MAEPIAWMVYTEDGKSVYVTDNPTDITDGQRALPLYTKPRMLDAYKFITQWKGLTDEELMEILGYGTIERSQTKDFDFVDVIDVKLTRSLINAIEAKLKEKNGG